MTICLSHTQTAAMSKLHQRLPLAGDDTDSDSDAEYDYGTDTSSDYIESDGSEPPTLLSEGGWQQRPLRDEQKLRKRKMESEMAERELMNNQFLYNKHVAVISVPGVILVLTLASDM